MPDEALRQELLRMASSPRGPVRAQRLWDILDDYESWPGRRLVGADGEAAAWLVAQQEIDDVELQRRCLELLEVAAALGDADPVHYAYLCDRVRMADGRPQLYGSQFVRADHGGLVPWHLDDLAKVEARRVRLGLPPFAEHARAVAAEYRARTDQSRTDQSRTDQGWIDQSGADGDTARQQYHAATDR